MDRSLYIDCNSLPNKLFNQLLDDPQEAIHYLEDIVKREYKKTVNVRFSHFPKRDAIKSLRSLKLNKFVSVQGIVRSVTDTNPCVVEAVFQCQGQGCKHRIQKQQDTFRLEYPDDPCISCGKLKWVFVPEKSKVVDYQLFKIQESPEGLHGGEVPAQVEVRIMDDQCNKVQAGNKVTVNGFLRVLPPKTKESLYLSTIFDANNIEMPSRDFDEISLSDEDVANIEHMSKNTNIFPDLVASIAPSIYGYEEIKGALLLQLFGGVRHHNRDGTYNRGDIHVLLIGDPGVAKSKLLDAIIQVIPRGIKTSGGSSTKAGLTVTAVQTDGVWTLEAGAVILADKGQLVIDELDKIRADDRSALHEAMEQQIVSVAKAGITTTLMARCSILAAANPKLGRFDSSYTTDIAEQINLPPTLLSRFDLIFCLTDTCSPDNDSRLADFILSSKLDTLKVPYEPDMVRKYIAYSKNLLPKISVTAQETIKGYYLKVRELASGGVKPVPITARQLESAMRLAEASARMRLSEEVSNEDAKRAVEIMDRCLKHIAYDPKTAVWDIDKMTNKMSKSKQDGITVLKKVVLDLMGKGDRAKVSEVIEVMGQQGYGINEVTKLIELGYQETIFSYPREGFVRLL